MSGVLPAAKRDGVYRMLESPVGSLKLVATDAGLRAILWGEDDPRRFKLNPAAESAEHALLRETETQLRQYFAGRRRGFDLPLDMQGTAFQVRVWTALLAIPFGETRTYGEIAQRLGVPTATRAVGAANGRNPISIVTPCHRVIGASGRLQGFAGGLAAKAILLNLENPGLFTGAW